MVEFYYNNKYPNLITCNLIKYQISLPDSKCKNKVTKTLQCRQPMMIPFNTKTALVESMNDKPSYLYSTLRILGKCTSTYLSHLFSENEDNIFILKLYRENIKP